MQYLSYYLIRPNGMLMDRLRSLGGDLQELLIDAVLWTMKRGDRSAFSDDDYTDAVKCLFLANLKYNILSGGEAANLFREIRVAPDCFDEWWLIETFNGYDCEAEVVASTLTHEECRAELGQTRNPVVTNLLSRTGGQLLGGPGGK